MQHDRLLIAGMQLKHPHHGVKNLSKSSATVEICRKTSVKTSRREQDCCVIMWQRQRGGKLHSLTNSPHPGRLIDALDEGLRIRKNYQNFLVMSENKPRLLIYFPVLLPIYMS